MLKSAYVHIWNKLAGAIAWNSEKRTGSFEYHPEFLETNWNLSPFKMPLENAKGTIFSFLETRDNATFKGLPGLLADVLPDKYGNALINAWLSRNGRSPDSLSPIEQLCFIGTRGMGALEFEPVQPFPNSKANKIEIDTLVELAQSIQSGKSDFKTEYDKHEEKALMDMLKIGTSAGGTRAKAVIAFDPLSKEIRSGQAKAPQGFSHWLIKFDGVSDQQIGVSNGYGKVEMAYHLMASDAGIDMMPCRLLEENGRSHFMTRRFDRTNDNEKVHVQSFCAMMHYDFNDILSYSYEQLFETMRRLRLPYTDAEQLYRRMVFNVLSRNCDDHTKNFSFMMRKNGEWRLSPAYDICHAYRPDSQWVSQHSLSINGKRTGIDRTDLLAVANNMNIKKAVNIIDQMNQTISDWSKYANRVDLDERLKKAIGSTLLTV